MTPAALPAFAQLIAPCSCSARSSCGRGKARLATFLLASRAAAMVTVRCVAAEVEAMGVDEGAWMAVGRYYRGTVDPDARPVFTGWADDDLSWCAGPVREVGAVNGDSETVTDARLAVQRAHLAWALGGGARGR